MAGFRTQDSKYADQSRFPGKRTKILWSKSRVWRTIVQGEGSLEFRNKNCSQGGGNSKEHSSHQ